MRWFISGNSILASLAAVASQQTVGEPVELDDEIIEAMRFVTPPPEAPVNKTNREKYSCPVCHINLWGKPGIVVNCGGEHCNKAALVVLK
ncbi:hypothetical protein MWG92_06920 [Escherichia coli]|nr:hypothetical protein [Escherichia coli]